MSLVWKEKLKTKGFFELEHHSVFGEFLIKLKWPFTYKLLKFTQFPWSLFLKLFPFC